MLATTPASLPKGANAVSLVEIEVRPVLLLDLNNCLEVTSLALHGVNALDDDHDLLPRAVGTRLTLRDAVAQDRVEVVCIIVPEHLVGNRRVSGSIVS